MKNYQPTSNLPQLRWAGSSQQQSNARRRDDFIKQIIEAAKNHDIPLRQDEEILKTLAQVQLHRDIPPHVYKGVTAVLGFLYTIAKQHQAETATQPTPPPKPPRQDPPMPPLPPKNLRDLPFI